MTVHDLSPKSEKTLTIHARDAYSRDGVKLVAKATYQVFCDEDQHWWDLVVRTTPKGYPRGPANWLGVRVKDEPIFSLCAALLPVSMEENDERVFRVKTGAEPHELRYDEDHILCFFANDTRGWEWNNFGSIKVTVKRIT